MIEIFNRNTDLIISSGKKEVVFNTISENVLLDDFDVSYP